MSQLGAHCKGTTSSGRSRSRRCRTPSSPSWPTTARTGPRPAAGAASSPHTWCVTHPCMTHPWCDSSSSFLAVVLSLRPGLFFFFVHRVLSIPAFNIDRGEPSAPPQWRVLTCGLRVWLPGGCPVAVRVLTVFCPCFVARSRRRRRRGYSTPTASFTTRPARFTTPSSGRAARTRSTAGGIPSHQSMRPLRNRAHETHTKPTSLVPPYSRRRMEEHSHSRCWWGHGI